MCFVDSLSNVCTNLDLMFFMIFRDLGRYIQISIGSIPLRQGYQIRVYLSSTPIAIGKSYQRIVANIGIIFQYS